MTVLRRVAVAGVIVALVTNGLLAALWSQQRRLIYYPSPGPVAPAALMLGGAEDVQIETADGLELEGWYLAGAGPAVLVFNGNGGDRTGRAPLAAALNRAGCSVLLFDYRGYGGNPGRPTEDGLALDAVAARDWLDARTGDQPLVYFGESLGAAVAVRLATEDPAHRPSAVVLRSPFTSLVDVAGRQFPWLPVGRLLLDRYPSVDLITGLQAPLLVIAGERDSLVPASLSRKLHDAAPGPKRFVLIPDADHNDPPLAEGPVVIKETVDFLTEHDLR